MKRIVLRRFGGPQVLEVETASAPDPAPGEVVVAVRACALGERDLQVREGNLPVELPRVPGREACGVVVQSCSPAVSFCEGDEVVLLPALSCGACLFCALGRDRACARYRRLGIDHDGALTERLAVPERALVLKPQGLTHAEAAASVLSLACAHEILMRAKLRPQETVLIMLRRTDAVAGAALQLARLLGARVIATAEDDEDVQIAQSLGAWNTIKVRQADLMDEVRKITVRRGADVVVDAANDPVVFGCVAPCARIAWLSGRGESCTVDARRLVDLGLTLLGAGEPSRAQVLEATGFLDRGDIDAPRVHSFPMERIIQAQRAAESAGAFRRVVVENPDA